MDAASARLDVPLLLPDTQLKLLLTIPWASKIWNLQWTSSIFSGNEFKASFPFWIIDTFSIFPVQLQSCSCALGGGWRFLLGAGVDARRCSCSPAGSGSLPGLGVSGDQRNTRGEKRPNQKKKPTKKLRRRKMFSDLWKYLSKFVCWTSPLLSYFSLCWCLGFIFYFCFCSLWVTWIVCDLKYLLVYCVRVICFLSIFMMIMQLHGVLVGFFLSLGFPHETVYYCVCSGKVLQAEGGS